MEDWIFDEVNSYVHLLFSPLFGRYDWNFVAEFHRSFNGTTCTSSFGCSLRFLNSKPISRLKCCLHLLCFVALLCDATVRSVDVVLKELVLAKGCSADGALVREVSWLQCLSMVFCHVVQQLPLIHLIHKDWVRSRNKNVNKNVSIPFHRLDTFHCPVPCWLHPACLPWPSHGCPASAALNLGPWKTGTGTSGSSTGADCRSSSGGFSPGEKEVIKV